MTDLHEAPRRAAVAVAVTAAVTTLAMASSLGCGDRAAIWSAEPQGTTAYGLAGSVAIVDPQAHRVVSLAATNARGDLAITRTPTGTGIVAAAALPDGSRLLVLTAGHRATLGDKQREERPALTMIGDSGATASATTSIDLGLTDPLDGLAVDPAGRWAVVYAATQAVADRAVVTNPNELVIVDLRAMTAVHHTVHSFGGRPTGFLFTPPLGLPAGTHQLLVVESEEDLALIAPETAADPASEITVRLADPSASRRPSVAAVVVDDGDPARTDDARIALRFDADSSVMTLQLGPAPGSAMGFLPAVNVTDVGGVPSDVAFVRTDGGLRLAALVPATNRAVLVDPVTSTTTGVALPSPYRRMSVVTGAAAPAGGAAAAGSDVALLWQGGAAGSGVAFWELGQAAGQPFRSIETVGITAAIAGVMAVPPPHANLALLETDNVSAFFVLDLAARTATPLVTAAPDVELSVSRDGTGDGKVWTFVPGQPDLASTDLVTKQVRTLRSDTAVTDLFEIARADGSGGRSLVALHGTGAFGATVYDAETEDDSQRRIYGAILTEGDYDDR